MSEEKEPLTATVFVEIQKNISIVWDFLYRDFQDATWMPMVERSEAIDGFEGKARIWHTSKLQGLSNQDVVISVDDAADEQKSFVFTTTPNDKKTWIPIILPKRFEYQTITIKLDAVNDVRTKVSLTVQPEFTWFGNLFASGFMNGISWAWDQILGALREALEDV